MRRIEVAAALLMLGLSVFVVWATSGLAYWSRLVPGPGFMPIWMSVAGAALAAGLLITAWRSDNDRSAGFPEGRGMLRLLVTYSLLWVSVLLVPQVGFLTATVGFMLVVYLVIFRKAILPSLVMTAVIGMMVHFLFNQWLGVRLPTGPWGF